MSTTLPAMSAVADYVQILAYGDSLTAGYYNQGEAFCSYIDALRPMLCAAATLSGDSTGASSPDAPEPVAIDV